MKNVRTKKDLCLVRNQIFSNFYLFLKQKNVEVSKTSQILVTILKFRVFFSNFPSPCKKKLAEKIMGKNVVFPINIEKYSLKFNPIYKNS